MNLQLKEKQVWILALKSIGWTKCDLKPDNRRHPSLMLKQDVRFFLKNLFVIEVWKTEPLWNKNKTRCHLLPAERQTVYLDERDVKKKQFKQFFSPFFFSFFQKDSKFKKIQKDVKIQKE